jgi:hypothetical protein
MRGFSACLLILGHESNLGLPFIASICLTRQSQGSSLFAFHFLRIHASGTTTSATTGRQQWPGGCGASRGYRDSDSSTPATPAIPRARPPPCHIQCPLSPDRRRHTHITRPTPAISACLFLLLLVVATQRRAIWALRACGVNGPPPAPQVCQAGGAGLQDRVRCPCCCRCRFRRPRRRRQKEGRDPGTQPRVRRLGRDSSTIAVGCGSCGLRLGCSMLM